MRTRSLAVLLLVVPLGALAADANLDPTFGTYGATAVNQAAGTGTTDRGEDIALQPDGKLVVAGTSGSGGNFAGGVLLSRFTASGGLDATFGTGGTVVTDVGGAVVEGVTVQSDGKILVVGAGDTAGNYGAENSSTLLIRYTSAGALDGGFGTGGVVKVHATPGYETGAGVAVRPDDRIVVAGWAYNELAPSTRPRIVLSRFLADGTPDASFGSGGVALLPAGIGNPAAGGDFATAVALQPDGKIVVGGYRYVLQGSGFVQTFLVLRTDASGVLDPTFGNGGVSSGGPGPEGSRIANGMELLPDGRIVLGGLAGASIAAARYLANGSPDGAFDVDGVAVAGETGGQVWWGGSDVVVDPAGRVVVVGSVSGLGRSDAAIARFGADGSLDATFAPGGKARIVIGSDSSMLTGAVRQPDGKIAVSGLVADQIYQPTVFDFALAVARFGGSCGDAVVDTGEQCDDGDTDGRDCCSAGCGFDPVGQSCNTADARPCTWDVCDGAGTCQVGGPWPANVCRTVTQPGKAALSIRNASPDTRDKLTWKWTVGQEVFMGELGEPLLGSTEYRLCLFGGGTFAAEHVIPPGTGWTTKPSGSWILKRHAAEAGITRVQLKSTVSVPGKSKAVVKGKGSLLAPAALPLATPVAAQLISNEGLCLTSTFATPSRNTEVQLKAKGQ